MTLCSTMSPRGKKQKQRSTSWRPSSWIPQKEIVTCIMVSIHLFIFSFSSLNLSCPLIYIRTDVWFGSLTRSVQRQELSHTLTGCSDNSLAWTLWHLFPKSALPSSCTWSAGSRKKDRMISYDCSDTVWWKCGTCSLQRLSRLCMIQRTLLDLVSVPVGLSLNNLIISNHNNLLM